MTAGRYPWRQTASGRVVTLGPEIDWRELDIAGDMAEALARLCRYGGDVPGGVYSVAQHSVMMADAALAETGDAFLAAHCLLHDGHEWIIGDMTRPTQEWFEALAQEFYGDRAVFAVLWHKAKQRIDAAVWRAARLPEPSPRIREMVAEYDLRMLATERAHLLMPPPKSWGTPVETARPIRTQGRIRIWSCARAATEFRDRLGALCPRAAAA